MTAEHELPGTADLVTQFRRFHYSAFRLETLQVYAGSGEDHALAAFHRGDPEPPPDPAEDDWAEMLRANNVAGRVQQRVHVVTEPISDYLAYELTWEYGPHHAAGEDIRVIPALRGWPCHVPKRDFWLFDSRDMFELHYDADGRWLGVTRVQEPVTVVEACFIRDAALHQSISWAEYMTYHPALARRLPKGT